MTDSIRFPSATSRQVQDDIRHNFSSNESAPLEVVAPDAPATPGRDAAIDQYSTRLSQLAGVARVDSLTGSYLAGFSIFAALCLLAIVGLGLVKTRWRTTWGALANARI